MHLNYDGQIDQIEQDLLNSFDNKLAIVNILKESTDASHANLFFYDEDEKNFYDKKKNLTIPLRFLEDGTISMIGKAYNTKELYFCNYVPFDSHYNVALDNPFKLKLTSQIILPIVWEDKVIGVVRFSRREHTFNKESIDIIKRLTRTLNKFFIYQIDKHKSKHHNESLEEFFVLESEEVHDYLNTIEHALNKLQTHTHNPEIQKLIHKASRHIESVTTYINTPHTIDNFSILPNITDNIRVLIADDVKMNVKILHAMIKQEDIFDIYFAYDGIEALEKVKEGYNSDNCIDILFLDHYMPGKLGLEVAQHIREYEKLHNKSKLFVVSITNDPKAIEEQKNLYDFHIPKPFVKSDIVSVLEQIQTLRVS